MRVDFNPLAGDEQVKQMKKILYTIIGMAWLMGCTKQVSTVNELFAVVSKGNYTMQDSMLTKAGWTKVFEDSFDSDLGKWDIWTGGACNNELQFYQSENLQLNSGVLEIHAKKETVTGRTLPANPALNSYDFTSGRIESKFRISANAETPKLRILARIKLPSGYGMWPAFWSYGHPWPTQGEIDFLEARGNEPDKYYTSYYFGTATQLFKEDVSAAISTGVDLSKSYHVYEVEWTETAITSYIDGVKVETKTKGTHLKDLFGKTQNIVLNLAVGGDFFVGLDKTKIEPGTMYVDWVKVFTSK